MSSGSPWQGFDDPSSSDDGAPSAAACEVSLDALRSLDARINRKAWNAAHPWLWTAGMKLAGRLLSGSQWESQRQDLVATAISQVVHGLITGSSDSYNQMTTLNDLVSMTQTIVRRRVTDFHRQQSRSCEEAVEELPECASEISELRFTPTELREHIEALDPPKPELFMDRFFGGLTTREVAERRGMAHGTVLTHFADGLRLLRERMGRLDT